MTDWQILPPPEIPAGLLAWTGDPFLAELLARRGLATVDQARAFLEPGFYRPAPPAALPDLEQAVARLEQAIERQELVCVWGDFDVDGQTATALLVSTLTRLGARVCFYIPDRLTESHGIKLPALQQQLARGVDLLLTCDTGIDAHQAVAAAGAAGVEVLITDHHDLPAELPPARAVINPKRLPPDHPLRELPGVGVAYKVAEGLFQAAGRPGERESLLDLVALGIVADVARQRGDTRYLLQKGLAVLQQTSRLGLQVLLENTGLKADPLTEEHIGFWLAPRLNALGRLGDARLGVELLTTTDLGRARIIALQLEALNDRRKLLVDRVVVQALGQLEDTPSLADYQAIVLAAADWHPGVIGLAASRLADQYGKPAILIALRPGGLGHGSARSVPGCDIHQALKSQAGLLASFGGHPMAAGLAIEPDRVAAFRRGLSAALAGCARPAARQLAIDALVELPRISGELLAAIRRLAPFGPGNPPVQLGCRGLRLVEERLFGKTGQHKRVVVQDGAGRQQEVIWWNGLAEPSPQGEFDLAFRLGVDDYRGGQAVQVIWLDARERLPAPAVAAPEWVDWRQEKEPLARLLGLESKIVWAEGVDLEDVAVAARHQLRPAEALVVWTAPPGHDLFRQALAVVHPRQVYLVGQPAPFDSWPAFVSRLLGLVKYALARRAGEVELPALAAALGQRETTVRLGLDWLAAQGKLAIAVESEALWLLRPAQAAPTPQAGELESMLKFALAETAAYRRFFRQAGLAALAKAAAGS